MRLALFAFALSFATAASAVEPPPSAQAVYVERRGLLEVDTQCHIFTPEVRAALQVTAMQARGTLLRGGWSTAQMNQLEGATINAARARHCNDPRTTSAAETARTAYNTTFRSNRMEFPGWEQDWSARRVPGNDGWRLSQSVDDPDAIFGVRRHAGRDELTLVLPGSDGGATAQLILRNPLRPQTTALDLAARVGRGLEAGTAGPGVAMSFNASTRTVEHPGWGQSQVVFVFPDTAFRTMLQLDPRETVEIRLEGRTRRRVLIEVGDVAAARGFLATRAD